MKNRTKSSDTNIELTRKRLITIAKLEIECWNKMPRGLVMVILWAFIHRVTTGETVEESFFSPSQCITDYQI